jgi:transposase
VVLDEFVPADHVCRVIDAFVEKLVMSELGFERAQAAETGRPGYNPRDLLKLYLYGSHAAHRLRDVAWPGTYMRKH